MDNPVNGATIITLEQLPPFKFITAEPVRDISKYLKKLILEANEEHLLELPPLTVMKKHFSCSQLTLYDALLILRMQGYDFNFASMDYPVRIWRRKK